MMNAETCGMMVLARVSSKGPFRRCPLITEMELNVIATDRAVAMRVYPYLNRKARRALVWLTRPASTVTVKS